MPLTRARRATFVFFALYGFTLGMWIVNIPTIKDRTGVDNATLGALLLVLGATAWVGMQVSGPVIDRFGSRPVLGASMYVMGAAICAPAFATNAVQLGFALTAVGLTNGVAEIAQNGHAVLVERRYGRPIMSAFHAFFSLGGLLASALGGGLIALGVDIRISLVAAGIIAVTTTRLTLPSLLKDGGGRRVDGGRRARVPWTSRVLVLGLLAFALLLAEGVAYDWSTVHLHDSLSSSKTVAALAYGAFSITMTIVRLFADRVVARWGPATYVSRAALLGAAGLVGVSLSPNAPLAIIAWAVFGVGLAGCVPQFFSTAGNVDPVASGTYLARVTGLGYVGLLAGPSIIGLLTHWVPLTTAFIVPIIGCVAAGLLAPRALAPPAPDPA